MPELNEPPTVIDCHCPDTFCSGIARIDRLSGDLLRFIIYAENYTPHGKEWMVVAKLIWPASAIPLAIRQASFALAERGTELVGDVARLM